MNESITGGCQCGQVRYAITGPLHNPHICHCRMCQKAFGNYFAALVGTARENFRWSRRQPGVFRSSSTVSRYFCSTCGTPLAFAYDESKNIGVAIGSLDNPAAVVPEQQYGIEAMLPAFAILHSLPGTRTEDGIKPGDLAKLKSLQHPRPRLVGKHRPYRFKRFCRFPCVRATGLRHVWSSAATLAAQ